MSETLDSIHVRIRNATDPAVVQRLTTLRPARAWRDLLLDWLLIALGVGLVLTVREPWAWVAAVAVVGSGQYRLFVLGHDGLHGGLHPDTRVNDRVARWAIYGPLFVGFDDSGHSHLVHHRALGTSEDPERYIHSLENKNSRLMLLAFCTGLVTFTRTFRKILPHGTFESPARVSGFVLQRVPVLLAQLALIGLLLALGLPWWSWLVLWVLPIYVMVFVPDEIRTFCPSPSRWSAATPTSSTVAATWASCCACGARCRAQRAARQAATEPAGALSASSRRAPARARRPVRGGCRAPPSRPAPAARARP